MAVQIVHFGALADAALISAVTLLRQFIRGDLMGLGTSVLRHDAGGRHPLGGVAARFRAMVPPCSHDRGEKGCHHDRVRIASARSLPHAA
jgi:hypothetical protein